MPPLDFMKTSLEHLPDRKRAELARACEILFEEFERARHPGLKAYDRGGRILKIILFGSYARGDWVDERGKTAKGYQSDFDLLVVVNYRQLADMGAYWRGAEEAILREKAIQTPVSLIVHALSDVNDKLAQGRYFFVDIVRDGVALYELEGHRLAAPKPLSPKEAYQTAEEYFEEWFSNAMYQFDRLFKVAFEDRKVKEAAFLLHQSVERLYACFLLVHTNYSPSTHNLSRLRSLAEEMDARLRDVWPDTNRFERRSFERLKDAYVKARYSKHYVITHEELGWLAERTQILSEHVRAACSAHLAALKHAAA